MFQLKLMSFARVSSTASLKIIRNASSAINHPPCDLHGSIQSSLHPQHRHAIHTTSSMNKFSFSDLIPEQNLWTKAKKKLKYYTFTKYQYRARAVLLYRHVVDSLDHVGFMRDFRMADTYYSWFLITELHVWMLMVRLTAGGEPISEFRRTLVYAMWEDAEARKKQLGKSPAPVVIPQMRLLGLQFRAALLGYDEGLMGSDKALAGAIWRRFLISECNNPEHVEKLVSYIRQNIKMLDEIPIHVLVNDAKVTFIDHTRC